MLTANATVLILAAPVDQLGDFPVALTLATDVLPYDLTTALQRTNVHQMIVRDAHTSVVRKNTTTMILRVE